MKYDILYFLARKTDIAIFRPFHWGVAFLYRLFIPKFLQLVLRGEIKLRHSVKNYSDFNVFYSDVDVTLIFPPSMSEEQVRKTHEKFLKLKKVFIFLGELEVMPEKYWLVYEHINSNYAEWYLIIKCCQKNVWFEQKLLSQQTGHIYHTEKTKRALQNLKLRLKFPLNQDFYISLEEKIKSLENIYSGQLKSEYIRKEYSYILLKNLKDLQVSDTGLKLFLALMPDGENYTDPQEIEMIRRLEPWKSVYLSLCAHEFFMANSNWILGLSREENLKNWIDKMKKIVDSQALSTSL